MCAQTALPFASSFSPCRRDLHAKVRVEILIGRTALCVNLCIHLPWKERMRDRDAASGRTRREIIHYVLGHNVAHPKQWQMRESGRIICKNGILPVVDVGRWYAYRMNVGAANIGHKAGNNCDSLYGLAWRMKFHGRNKIPNLRRGRSALRPPPLPLGPHCGSTIKLFIIAP